MPSQSPSYKAKPINTGPLKEILPLIERITLAILQIPSNTCLVTPFAETAQDVLVRGRVFLLVGPISDNTGAGCRQHSGANEVI